MNFGVPLGIFTVIFGVTLGIFTGMFQASSGEFWGGFGHFYRDVSGKFR